MAEQYQQFVEAGAEVVAVVHDTLENARDHFQRNRIPFPCLVDPEHRVYDLYGAESRILSLGQRPALFVIDTEGIVRFAHVGRQQWEIPSNAEVLEACRRIPCLVGA